MSKVEIFVFGSNLAGRHGKGSALAAVKYHGAIPGAAEGRQRFSYAIPTKDQNLKVLSLKEIQSYVWKFMAYANDHSDMQFNVVDIGCGLAGYKPEDIAPLFFGSPPNCNFVGELKRCVVLRRL